MRNKKLHLAQDFFVETKPLQNNISKVLKNYIKEVKDPFVKKILSQRNKTSSHMKECLAYFIAKGLGSKLSNNELLKFVAAIEIFCSGFMILDNYADRHYERNYKTTFLKEFGDTYHVFASHYAIQLGLKYLLPFLSIFTDNSFLYNYDFVVQGMIETDLTKSKSFQQHMRSNKYTNGYYQEMPYVVAASLGTNNKKIIKKFSNFGLCLGLGVMIYDETRDLLGAHGRRRATEVESGRIITAVHIASTRDKRIKNFVGKKLSKTQYRHLITILEKTNALNKTERIVRKYFQKALSYIPKEFHKHERRMIESFVSTMERQLHDLIVKK